MGRMKAARQRVASTSRRDQPATRNTSSIMTTGRSRPALHAREAFPDRPRPSQSSNTAADRAFRWNAKIRKGHTLSQEIRRQGDNIERLYRLPLAGQIRIARPHDAEIVHMRLRCACQRHPAREPQPRVCDHRGNSGVEPARSPAAARPAGRGVARLSKSRGARASPGRDSAGVDPAIDEMRRVADHQVPLLGGRNVSRLSERWAELSPQGRCARPCGGRRRPLPD